MDVEIEKIVIQELPKEIPPLSEEEMRKITHTIAMAILEKRKPEIPPNEFHYGGC